MSGVKFSCSLSKVLKLSAAGKSKMVQARRKMYFKSVSEGTAKNKLELERPGAGFNFGGKLDILCKAIKDGGSVSCFTI